MCFFPLLAAVMQRRTKERERERELEVDKLESWISEQRKRARDEIDLIMAKTGGGTGKKNSLSLSTSPRLFSSL